MKMSRQLINLAGGLAAIVILALGILLVALPMFTQARATEAQASDIVRTNDIYEIQVQTLRAQEAELAELEGELGGLRAQIPATGMNDEVYELVGDAADQLGVSVTSVTASESEPWTAGSVDGAPPVEETAPAEEGTPAETPEDATATEETPPAPSTELEPQRVVPFTIIVTTTDAAQAAQFIDALRGAERLMTVEHTVLTEEEGGYQLVVNARSLVLAEN